MGLRLSPFDVMVLNAALEHVHDPLSLMRAVSALSRRGGVLYLDVPREPYLLTVVGNAWNRLRGSSAILNLQPAWSPFHVYGLNSRSLEVLLNKTGFRLESVRVHASREAPSGPRQKDWLQAKVNRLANLLQFSSNMYGWARRERV